jgi:hypothetical protein
LDAGSIRVPKPAATTTPLRIFTMEDARTVARYDG